LNKNKVYLQFLFKKIIHLFKKQKIRKIYTNLSFYKNNSNKLIIAFSGMYLNDLTLNDQEFFKLTKHKVDVLFVQDLTDSWFNNLELNKIKRYINHKEVYALGNSMGGYNAIMVSNIFKIKKVIAFNPQFSIHPKFAPYETRYLNAAARIKKWKYFKLKFNQKTKYKIFFGDKDKRDKLHYNNIIKKNNIEKQLINGTGHDLAQELKKKGSLYKIIKNFFEI